MGGKRAPEGQQAAKRAPKKGPAAKEASADVEDLAAQFKFEPAEVAQIRSGLLQWYDLNHRVLPWRRNPHSQLSAERLAAAAAEGQEGAPLDLPRNEFVYFVWICEVMSQQTQVSRAAEYFRRWVSKWPTVQELAGASQEEVNELWTGAPLDRFMSDQSINQATTYQGQWSPGTGWGVECI